MTGKKEKKKLYYLQNFIFYYLLYNKNKKYTSMNILLIYTYIKFYFLMSHCNQTKNNPPHKKT